MNSEFEWLYAHFPKQRPQLPVAYQKIYKEEYKRNRGNNTSKPDLKQKLEYWMHRQVANTTAPEGAILEIGAGTLSHVGREDFARPYDIVEPFASLYDKQTAHTLVRKIYHDIRQVPAETEYTKILSVAVLEHVKDLPHVLATCALLLRDDGVMVNGIPTEGGLLWYLAWRFGTGLSFRLRTGLPYAKLMHYEHVNNCSEILRVLRVFFDDVRLTRFPLPLLHGSFYTCIFARIPNKARAQVFLETIQ